jgi:hypothetical protein
VGGPQFRVGPDQDARLETICGAYYWFIDGSIRARFVSLLKNDEDRLPLATLKSRRTIVTAVAGMPPVSTA